MNILMNYNTGLNLYFIVIDGNGSIWDGSTFSVYDELSWSDYAVSLIETSPGIYQGDFPTGITDAGVYNLVSYVKIGVNPDINDPSVGWGNITWDGYVEAVGGFGCLAEEFEFAVGIPNSVVTNFGQRNGLPQSGIILGENPSIASETIVTSEVTTISDSTVIVREGHTTDDVVITSGVR